MPPLVIDGQFNNARCATITASISVTTPYIFAPGGGALAVPAGPDSFILASAAQSLSSKTLLQPTLQSASMTSPSITGGTFAGGGTLTAPVITSGNLTQPVITSATMTSPTILGGGSWASGTFTQPTVTSGSLTSPTFQGGTMTGATVASAQITTCTLSSPTIVMTGGQMSGGIFWNTVWGGRTVFSLAAGTPRTLDLATADVFYCSVSTAVTLTCANATTGKMFWVKVQQTNANNFSVLTWMTGTLAPGGPTSSTAAGKTGAIDVWGFWFDGQNYIVATKATDLA